MFVHLRQEYNLLLLERLNIPLFPLAVEKPCYWFTLYLISTDNLDYTSICVISDYDLTEIYVCKIMIIPYYLKLV